MVNLRLDLRLSFSWNMDFFVYMDGHPQAMVVLFPCSLATQGFKEATMGITVCLFVFLLHGAQQEGGVLHIWSISLVYGFSWADA